MVSSGAESVCQTAMGLGKRPTGVLDGGRWLGRGFVVGHGCAEEQPFYYWPESSVFPRSTSLSLPMAQQNPQKPPSRFMVVCLFSLLIALYALNLLWVDGRRRILSRGSTSGSFLGAFHLLVAKFSSLCRWSWCRSSQPADFKLYTNRVCSNKWVLNATEAPLFFLWTQLVIAVLLFLLSSVLRLLPDHLSFDLAVCKDLVPLVLLNVASLRYVLPHTICSSSPTSVVQLQQLYSEICRCLLLSGCAWSLATLHRRNVLCLATLPSLSPHPLRVFICNCRFRRWGFPRWHTYIFNWCRLWRGQLSHCLGSLCCDQEESQYCKWQCSLAVMVQQPFERYCVDARHRIGR